LAEGGTSQRSPSEQKMMQLIGTWMGNDYCVREGIRFCSLRGDRKGGKKGEGETRIGKPPNTKSHNKTAEMYTVLIPTRFVKEFRKKIPKKSGPAKPPVTDGG